MAHVLLAQLAPSVRSKLQKAGLCDARALAGMRPTVLSKEAGITHDEAVTVLQVISSSTGDTDAAGGQKAESAPLRAESALAILERQQQSVSIVTFSQALDDLLGGGVPVGCVTEFCGIPGIGKTQIGMQLALDVQIPEAVGGVAGSAIYIDTEGSFVIQRAQQMAGALLKHLQEICRNNAEISSLTVEAILDKILYYRVHDVAEQLALINVLPAYLTANPEQRVKLVVLDSVAFHFRHGFVDMAHRSRVLQALAQQLHELASTFGMAVVVTNQVTTKFRDGNAGSFLVPALGESWAHAVTNRILLYPDSSGSSIRQAMLYKSPSRPSGTAPFHIGSSGVRDVKRASEARKRKLEQT
eukprot:TRINITY_DN16716_c0_g1_i1.p1 TRINITY_DN16716_c0_g1~~TRINITY_DN16716_c0_g1_i1.p1  ORF type:complete len:357 (-),score=48.95 TRINITY_DN16716_c0_g1_i1:9-1079(-)